jgi:nickel-dependent lactate racemase
MARVTIPFGLEQIGVTMADRQLVPVHRGPEASALGDVGAAIRQTLEAPHDFPPLRQALTPDDHVAVVVCEGLSHLSELLGPVLEHLQSAGVQLDNVTVLCPPRDRDGDAEPAWHEALAGALRGVRVEVHAPADRAKLAYLASTAAGRRVYLNKTLVDADQLVVLGRAGFDPVLGYGGGLGDLFPALSDAPTRAEFAQRITENAPGQGPWAAREEAKEVGWLLGMPFVIEVVEGPGDTLAAVLGGRAAAVAAAARQLLDRHWKVSVPRQADLVVAAVSGAPEGQTFADVARALACAARVVSVGGRIAVLSRTRDPGGPGVALLRGSDGPAQGLLRARQAHSPDVQAVWQLAAAAQHAQLYLYSDLPAAQVEETFLVPLDQPGQVQRLIDQAASCLVLPDAHRTLAVVEK